MLKAEVIKKIEELEQSLPEAQGIDETFYRELLDEWAIYIWALKFIGNSYPYERAINMEDRKTQLELELSDSSREVCEEYIRLCDLLEIIYYEVPNLRKEPRTSPNLR